MGRRSSVDALPQDVRDWIMRLREQGASYDDIVAKLRELDGLAVPVPSRSALHRAVQEAERLREIAKRQHIIAEAMVKNLGEVDDSKIARGNVAMAHAILTRMHAAALDAMNSGDGTVIYSPGEIMFLCKAMDHLGKVAKDDVARTLAIEKRARERDLRKIEETVAAAEAAGQKLDGPATLKKIREEVYGIYDE